MHEAPRMIPSPPSMPPSPFRAWLAQRGSPRRGWEKLIEWALFACGLFSIGITLAIATVILVGSFDFFTTERVVVQTPQGKEYRQELMAWPDIWERVSYFFAGREW